MNSDETRGDKAGVATSKILGIGGADERVAPVDPLTEPLRAMCENEHEAKVPVYGIVKRDPAPGRAIQIFEIRAHTGQEKPLLIEALGQIEVGDWVIYHRGETGSAPTGVKAAARWAYDAGLCTLTQRIVLGSGTEIRQVEYIAIKLGRRAR